MEFTSETQSYYKQDGAVQGEWQGQLAEQYGLFGSVSAEDFALLAEGKHPQTGQELVKHRTAQEYNAADGTTTVAVEHRAGWDATFSAPKSVSLTALVGGDERMKEAHCAAVTTALDELEGYTQAGMGGNNPAETNGKVIAAKFEHDTARPVDGYAAPQLHTHAIIFNVTERADGSTRTLQERAFFESKNFAMAVYQSALTHKLHKLGYELEQGKSGAPEIKGYSAAYLGACSPRSRQIRYKWKRPATADPIPATASGSRCREGSIRPQIHGRSMGTNPRRLSPLPASGPKSRVTKRMEPGPQKRLSPMRVKITLSVRPGWISGRFCAMLSGAEWMIPPTPRYGPSSTIARNKASFFPRRPEIRHRRSFTMPKTIAHERTNVRHVPQGRNATEPMMKAAEAQAQARTESKLNSTQRAVIEEVLTSSDRVHGLQGLAGSGKTKVLRVIREGAETSGYTVEGFAPSSKAAGALRDAGCGMPG